VSGASAAIFGCSVEPVPGRWPDEPDWYRSLFTELVGSGLLVVGTWNVAPEGSEVLVAIARQAASDETLVQITLPEPGTSFRQQISSLSPEIRNDPDFQLLYEHPNARVTHSPLLDHVRYRTHALDPQSCAAVAEFRASLGAIALLSTAHADGTLSDFNEEFFFVGSPGYPRMWVPTRHSASYAYMAPILRRLQSCVQN
jgi:hypothetical protein